jgi:hypothetical protein
LLGLQGDKTGGRERWLKALFFMENILSRGLLPEGQLSLKRALL